MITYFKIMYLLFCKVALKLMKDFKNQYCLLNANPQINNVLGKEKESNPTLAVDVALNAMD